jgi:uroporphyrinogen decarboxylase
MTSRRAFFLSSAAALGLRGAARLTPKERVDRALTGRDVDRAPFTFWHHFLDTTVPGAAHAHSTLEFHNRFRTDLVKVMSDYTYPKPKGEWFELKVESNPFPRQIEALRIIRDGLGGKAHFVETLFNPYKVAENLSSPAEVQRMKTEKPQRLLDALEIIAKSEANHARDAIDARASGVFLAIANSADPDYRKFSEPFDRLVLDAAKTAPLNVLHIHGDKIVLGRYYNDWPASAINYSIHGTRIPFADVRKRWSGILMGGVDENNFRKLPPAEVQRQVAQARKEAGVKYIAAGGCSVPNDTTDAEMLGAIHSLGA